MSDKLKNDDYKFGDKYKFKALRCYSSTEWMANSTKKYRSVFDKDEVDYVRCEFAFWNKLFDEREWTAKIRLKCFGNKGGIKRKEICDQESEEIIRPDQNTVYIHKGWGTDKIGGFWKKGEYVWEAYIDEKFVGSQKFFIEEVGKVSLGDNPYFDLISVKLFSGPFDGYSIKNRKYLKKFHRDNTQYVWVEVKFKNRVSDDWHSELFINHYDHAGQFKAQIISFKTIEAGQKNQIYTFEEGWGSKEGGTWKDERYTVEVVFMDTLIAIVPLEVGNEEVEGDNQMVLYPDFKMSSGGFSIKKDESNEVKEEEKEEPITPMMETVEDVLKELDGLIGLGEIKKKIRDHISYLDFLKLRQTKGFSDAEKIVLHSVFTGNPGTGKTTVVKLLGQIYHKMGLLSDGMVHEVDRVDLVGEFIGQTAPKVKDAIERAKGGILFIDEAYSLARRDGDSKDFGKEVLEVLIKEMSDGSGDIAIMYAGYPVEMQNMLDSNPGLRSRIKYYFHFDDYTPDELLKIADYASVKREVEFDTDAKEQVRKILLESYRNRDRTFGNARFAFSIIDEAKMNLGLRVMKMENVHKLTRNVLSTVVVDDVKKIDFKKIKKRIDITIDEDLLRESMTELNGLIGLTSVKTAVTDLVKLVRYYREIGKDVLNQFSLHSVFVGNPGTGKTTVARIIGKIFKSLGLLERGHIVECDREGLIAGYIGQTAIKTKERIDEARGGVLFIDEAYSLAEGSHSYGGEAIEVILKNMEDLRGEFVVIAAGYPENMESFLKMNPGLKSRFDQNYYFQDFTTDELYKIALEMLVLENLTPDEKAEEFLKQKFADMVRKKDKYFGNARTIRKVVEAAIKNQNLRMAFFPSESRTEEMKKTLTFDDVKDVVQEEMSKASVGFRYTH